MHSEIYLHFTDEVTIPRLIAGMPESADHAQAHSQTYFRDDLDLLIAIVYAHSEASSIYLVFQDDEYSLRIHVESRQDRGNLKRLVSKSEEVAQRFRDVAKRANYKIDDLKISLFADEYLITTGVHRPFWSTLWYRFTETIFSDIIIGISTCLLTGILTGKWIEGAVAGGAAIICLLGWLIIQTRRKIQSYDYERF
jgi:hypothetical protein